MKFAPLHDYALLEPLVPPNKVGNVFLPTEIATKEMKLPLAKVLAVGPQFETTKNTVTEEVCASGVQVGDTVILAAFQRLQLPSGQYHYLARRSQIVAVVDLEGEDWKPAKEQPEAPLPMPALRPPGSIAGAAGMPGPKLVTPD